jgi:hypothetical protein
MNGPSLAKPGTCAKFHAALSRASVGILEILRTTAGENVNLAVLDQAEIVSLGPNPTRFPWG